MPTDDPTWQELADRIHVDVRDIYRWRKEPDSPQDKDEIAWAAFASTRIRKGAAAVADAMGDDDEEPIVIGETFAEARTRREIAGADREEYNRDIAKIERDTLRGKLVTSKEAKAAAAEVRDAFLAVGKQLWGRTDQLLGDSLPASERQRIAQAMQQAWEALLSELSV